jgi:hypothetical protein
LPLIAAVAAAAAAAAAVGSMAAVPKARRQGEHRTLLQEEALHRTCLLQSGWFAQAIQLLIMVCTMIILMGKGQEATSISAAEKQRETHERSEVHKLFSCLGLIKEGHSNLSSD